MVTAGTSRHRSSCSAASSPSSGRNSTYPAVRIWPATSFVPVAPLRKTGVPFTVLFVGQAVGKGFSTENTDGYDQAVKWAVAQVDYCLTNQCGVFWRTAFRIIEKASRRIDYEIATNLYKDMVGFTNLAKIAKIGGNPKPLQIRSQAEYCVAQMRSEIELAQPTVIVMMVRNFAQNEIIEPVFGKDGWQFDNQERDRVAFKRHGKIPVIWMNHPRNPGKAGHFAVSIEFAIEQISQEVEARS